MSATNRGGLTRHPGDFYETPASAIDPILKEIGITPEFTGYVIDAGAGTGAIANRVALAAPKADVRAIEVNPELAQRGRDSREKSIAWETCDWLTWKSDGQPEIVIANPPYGPREDRQLAEKFIRKALEVSGRKATVAMLLRANYLIPRAREALRKEFGLPAMYALERRPSFNRSGTDATEYAWFVWRPGANAKQGFYSVLTPPAKQRPARLDALT